MSSERPYLNDAEEMSIRYIRLTAKALRDDGLDALADAALVVANGLDDARETLWVRSSSGMESGYTTEDYMLSVAPGGPMYGAWKNKPHRLVYDLCGEVDRLNARIRELEAGK